MPPGKEPHFEKILPPPASLERMISIAGLAPSPENNQPWRFEIHSDHVQLKYVKARRISSDRRHLLNFISLGAALENLRLAAAGQGYHIQVDHPPVLDLIDGDPLPIVARISFSIASTKTSMLLEYTSSRFTDRSLYSEKWLAEEFLTEISCIKDPRAQMILAEPSLKNFARAIKILDQIRFEKKNFHTELYQSLRFSAAEAARTKDGLDIRTLALPAGSSGILRLLSYWKIFKFLNFLGLSRFFSAISEKQILSSAGLFLISAKDYSPLGCLEAGMLFQKICLIAQKHQVSFQPYAHFAIFNHFSLEDSLQGNGEVFLPRHKTMIQKAALLIQPYLEAGQVPMMALRVGYSKAAQPPRTFRYSLSQILKYQKST